MADPKETVMGYTDQDKFASFCSAEQKWITKILRYKEEHPDEVSIVKLPKENNGYILAYIPKSWFKMSPKRKMNYSDEYRAKLADMLRANKAKSQGENSQN